MELKKFNKALPAALVTVFALAQFGDVGANTYRYKNDEGVQVIAGSVPAQFKDKGYEVVGKNGRVIQTVEPALTGVEKNERAEQRAAENKKRTLAEQREESDKILRRRFASVEEMQKSKARALKEIADAKVLLNQK